MIRLSWEEYVRLSRPVFGRANPERIDNPLWEAIIREGWGGYALRNAFKDRRAVSASGSETWRARESETPPPWCWERFGQTRTDLPDGRIIHVGGEHEDSYDPDFCIFNDVVVENPDGALMIFAYPVDVFPPTDFHSATLVSTPDGGQALILIGNLGYADTRRYNETQVLRLDLTSFAIEPVPVRGDGPGWISRHEAALEQDGRIRVSGGKLCRPKENGRGYRYPDQTQEYWLTPDPKKDGGYVWERDGSV